MILHASASLSLQKQAINDLNVFPVPDGDTGTNMSLTISTAAGELTKKNPTEIGKAASINASGMLRGARGNSGVILSLLFRGFAKALKDQTEIDGAQFAAALNEGVTAAYSAVMKPAEGTILTVSRLSAVRAVTAAEKNPAIEYVLGETIKAGEAALENTVNQNPVLKKAGVIDAGGKGYIIILQGMLDELKGKKMPKAAPAAEEKKEAPREKADFTAFETEDIKFSYCTEFICSRDNDKDPELMRKWLTTMGDSLVFVDDDEIIKVHVHTNHPGQVMEEALTYGALLKAKIENMKEQHTEILGQGDLAKGAQHHAELVESDAAVQEAARIIAPPEKKYGFVTVCAGAGLEAVFRDLGVDGVISGGQTMNPSTEDILKVIDQTPAEVVFVLPNNKNIVMAAQQCIDLSDEKTVIVIPTHTVPQGVAAMLAVEPDAEASVIQAAMEEAIRRVSTAQITYAARNSNLDGFDIQEGDYLALQDGKLFGTKKDLNALLADLARNEAQQEAEFITLFYGEDVTEAQADQAAELFAQACPNAEVSAIPGGQPVYYYMISAE